VLGLSGCAKSGGRVDIFLLDPGLTVPEALEMPLTQLPLATEPLIADEDILSYDWKTHRFEITETAMDRVMEMEVPVSGVPFAVAVDRQPVYVGAFWVLWSSLSFDGVVIIPPMEKEATSLVLEAGYPGYPIDETWSDPRPDERIFQVLKESGKIR
jgi:hypothetical protein